MYLLQSVLHFCTAEYLSCLGIVAVVITVRLRKRRKAKGDEAHWSISKRPVRLSRYPTVIVRIILQFVQYVRLFEIGKRLMGVLFQYASTRPWPLI